MVIHIYLSSGDIKDKNVLSLGLEEVLVAIENKQECIHTTELIAISHEISYIYNYVFHYNGEEISISKDEMEDIAFYNCIGRICDCFSYNFEGYKMLCGNIFKIAKDCYAYWLKTLKDIEKDDKAISAISSKVDYVRYRLNYIVNSERTYLLLVVMLIFCNFTEMTIVEHKIYTIAIVLLLFLMEFLNFRNVMEQKNKLKR